MSGTGRARIRTRCRKDLEDCRLRCSTRSVPLSNGETGLGRDFGESHLILHGARNEKSGDSLLMNISAPVISVGSSGEVVDPSSPEDL